MELVCTNYKFYAEYIKLLDQDYEFRKEKSLTELEKKLKHTKFRNYYLNEKGFNYESILKIHKIMRSGMLRPQRLIIDSDTFYIACDMLTNTYYICYKEIMMIDIDFYKDSEGKSQEIQLSEAVKLFEQDNLDSGRSWILYRSKGGIHAFLSSECMEYHTKESCDLMIKLKCDFNYIIYSYLRGWCVRLNRKKTETKLEYTLIKEIGVCDKENKKMIDMHIKLVDIFKDEYPSNMYGV